jgi:hypothetical protein
MSYSDWLFLIVNRQFDFVPRGWHKGPTKHKQPHDEFQHPNRLIAAFGRLKSLQSLEILIPHGFIGTFKSQMAKIKSALFPTVSTLSIPICAGYVLRHCPNLHTMDLVYSPSLAFGYTYFNDSLDTTSIGNSHKQMLALSRFLNSRSVNKEAIKNLVVGRKYGRYHVEMLKGK